MSQDIIRQSLEDAPQNAKWVYNSDQSFLSLLRFDFIDAWSHWRTWLKLGWAELAARYGRTSIGAAWNVISFSIFCFAIILLFGEVAVQQGERFGQHVVIGFLAYGLLVNLINDGCSTFIQSSSWITGMRLPLGMFIFKMIYRNLITFSFNLAAATVILLVFYKFTPSNSQWTLIPAVILYLFTAFNAAVLLGIICARFRDMLHLMQTLTRFALFVTPIMWQVDDSGVRALIAQFNPFTHFIAIVREPIIRGEIAIHSWIISIGISFAIMFAAVVVYAIARKRLVYWL